MFEGLNALEGIHPLVVHFPIVLTLLALLSQVWEQLRGLPDGLKKAPVLLLYLSAVSALVSVATGYWTTELLGHETPGHEFVHTHRDVMVWYTSILVLGTLVHLIVKKCQTGIYRLFLLIVTTGIMVVGTDLGGQLVYRYGVGVKSGISSSENSEDQGEAEGQEKQETHIHPNGSEHVH